MLSVANRRKLFAMTVTQMPTSEEITQRWVATTIKTVMASRGMRQRDLADAVGMTDAHLSQKLNQKNRISIQDVVEVASVLEVDPGELLNGWSGKVPRTVTHEYQPVRSLYAVAA